MWSMVKFRQVVQGTSVDNWWNSGSNHVAFSRGNRGFVVFNAENWDLNQTIRTGLPSGTYCDVISGEKSGNGCTGKKIVVDGSGNAQFSIPGGSGDGVIAIHVEAKL
jgi:alpha-amylase